MSSSLRRRPLRSTRATWRVGLFVVLFLLGISGGLYLGWVVAPVSVANTTLDTLNQNYQDDYVLMTASAYSQTRDLETARTRLKTLGLTLPGPKLAETFNRSAASGASEADLRHLVQLANGLGETTPAMQPYLP